MIPLETISIISTKYDAHHIIMANYVNFNLIMIWVNL